MKPNALLLFPLLAACVDADVDAVDTTDQAVVLPATKVCSTDVVLHPTTDYVALAALHQDFPNGGARLISATMLGTVTSSSQSATPMQGLRITCSGPENRIIQTTENAIKGGGALATKASLTIVGPGGWDCWLGGITMHEGAALAVTGNQTCLSSAVSDAQDWPHWPEDRVAVGLGQRISKHQPRYVLIHDVTLAPDVATFGVRGNIELTDIVGTASGTSLTECEVAPYTEGAPAYPTIRIEARQKSTTGYCGGATIGPELATTISAKSHHKKVYPVLDNVPVSNALGCLPKFEVKVHIGAKDGGNDLCFHAANYSNTIVVPQTYDGPVNAPL